MNITNLYPWQRYWVPRGENIGLDSYGLATRFDNKYPSSVICHTLEELADVPCLILLGEPAIGKSTTITNVNDTLAKLVFKLNTSSIESELVKSIEYQPAFQQWLENDTRLYLYLDALDEAMLNIATIHNYLPEWLNTNRDRFKIFDDRKNKLFVRITCRSAKWDDECGRKLQNLFGTDNVRELELVPLDQECIRTAAKIEGIDENDFLEAIKSQGLTSFATEPITLRFLINSYRNKGLSDSDKSKIYQEGCLELCNEVNPDYKKRAVVLPGERLRIASRLALYTLLCNKPIVGKFISPSESNNQLFHFDDIVGDPTGAAGETVTLTKIDETLNTALFSLEEENKFQFKHRSFAEFLAAWQLNHLQPTDHQILQFLTSPFDSRKAIPQIQEVLTWLGSMNQKVLELFIPSEPLLVLRCSTKLSETQRKAIVNSILKLSDRFAIVDDYESNKFYDRLSFNGISKLLAPFINGDRRSIVSRRIACQIAAACRVVALQKQLVAVLQNVKLDRTLRTNAMRALIKFNNHDADAILRLYALQYHEDDMDDELKGTALNALYPSQISTIDMFESLQQARNRNLYGAYRLFIDSLEESIPDHDLDVTLGIASEDFDKYGKGRHNDFEKLLGKIIHRSWHHTLSKEGLDQLANLIWKMRNQFQSFPVVKDAPQRKAVVERLLLLANRPSDIFSILGRSGNGEPIVYDTDWDWLVAKADTSDTQTRTTISQILWHFTLGNSTKTNHFLELVYNDPELRAVHVQLFRVIELDSEEATQMKEFNLVHAVAHAKSEAPKPGLPIDFNPLEKATEYIDQSNSGNQDAWWRLIYLLRINPTEGTYNELHDFEFDITKLPLWQSIVNHQTKVLECAKTYLSIFTPTSPWISTGQFRRPELAGYKAMLLLYKYEPEYLKGFQVDFWQDWSATIIYCSFHTLNQLPEERKYVLRICVSFKENTYFFTALRKYLIYELKKGRDLYDIYKIEDIASDRIAKELITILYREECNETNQSYILEYLFKNKLVRARKIAEKWFSQLIAGKLPEKRKELVLLASSKLFLHPVATTWDFFWEKLKASEIIEDVFMKAAPYLAFRGGHPQQDLTPNQKANILVWLYERFPPHKDPIHETAYSPSDRDNLGDYRSTLVRDLISEGSVQSVAAIKKITRKATDSNAFKWWLVSARENMRLKTWVPLEPSQLKEGLRDINARLVRSEAELSTVIQESLARFQKMLQGINPTSYFLWNWYKDKFTHKDENALSDFVKMHLEYDLIQRKVIINREVEIKRSTIKGSGSRTDLLVQALTPQDTQILSVVIEVKGNWNTELDSAMREQLKEKYMSRYKCTTGIYLVGWYYCEHARKTHPWGKKLTDLRRRLAAQARQLSEPDISITPFVLDCRL